MLDLPIINTIDCIDIVVIANVIIVQINLKIVHNDITIIITERFSLNKFPNEFSNKFSNILFPATNLDVPLSSH